MQITVCDLDRIANVDLTDDCPIENLLALVSVFFSNFKYDFIIYKLQVMADLENDSHDISLVRLLKDGVDVLVDGRSKTLAVRGSFFLLFLF